ncbi:hypothetical protein NQ314_003102 [Rhamnusium bicolor]|uniref:Galactose mutarotase n=1 Tax=Rhamnusium bicolor TaxID=1586634 RepID=A0AAV8ZPP6_9CUCU|nr:hypothetical protein NQ314_003102 [Rhamnusium bicolor]
MIYENQIVLNRGDYTSCSINVLGATVTSWRIHHQEQLFVSRESHFSGISHIRGGISFVFPHFGEWNMGPRHGFAREIAWSLDKGPEKLENGDVFATLSLDHNDYTHSLWNYKFKLLYKITLCEQKLIFNIFVENGCENFPFEFEILQHSLFKVPDVRKCEIIGLHKCRFRKAGKSDETQLEDRQIIKIAGKIDRIYAKVPREVTVSNMMNGGTLKIVRKNTYDVNLWNPWVHEANEIRDLGTVSG